MFESFCRIHHSVGIDMLAEKLNMNVDDAEKWIVHLIRNARMDAKIDSQKGLIVMGTQKVSPYQQVIERTKTSGSCAHKLLERLRWEKALDTETVCPPPAYTFTIDAPVFLCSPSCWDSSSSILCILAFYTDGSYDVAVYYLLQTTS
ncbi:unnamed protein product [Dicrocoelium dendriticum]|nr:unnamed protein product [Dicrocoelium dendriticum]